MWNLKRKDPLDKQGWRLNKWIVDNLKVEKKLCDFSKNTSNVNNVITYEENNSVEYEIGKKFYKIIY